MRSVEAFGRLCLLAVFLWSAFSKIRNFTDFRQHVATTIPRLASVAGPLAAAVTTAECAAAFLLFHPLEWVGVAVAALLLAAFTVYLLTLMRTDPEASCGCAGVTDTSVSGVHVVRNAILIADCGAIWWVTSYSAGPSLFDYAVMAGPAAAAAVVVLHLGELAAFFRPAAMK
ncbi:MauE/DoxX family redox-associated membrane protein [Streptomyces bobili]|uniref:MauE/DoxX family redox-associated membrane protein n=1 Tax=Streptomyces bobili TaxID=67280 RepID=UPI00343D0DD4